MKRAHDRAFARARPCTRSTTRRRLMFDAAPVAPSLDLLPGDMIKEIFHRLVPSRSEKTLVGVSFWEKFHALKALREVNRLLHVVGTNVLQDLWAVPYQEAKRLCRSHDWTKPCAELRKPLRDLYDIHYFFYDLGFHEHAQFGWLNAPLFAPIDRDIANATIDVIDKVWNHDRRERARERWFQTSSKNHTFAHLLWFVQPYIEYPMLADIFAAMLPAWIRLDADDCLVHLLLWMECHGGCWEDLEYFRKATVGLVLAEKFTPAITLCRCWVHRRHALDYDLLHHWLGWKDREIKDFGSFLESMHTDLNKKDCCY